tara:strand:- start:3 stop:677 length:675 start_codon:yes stop_codon:yes gene_type:complete
MAKNWGQDELEASVKSYLEMKSKESQGVKFSKKKYYEDLSQQFERTEKSFEYRMQNISFVFSEMGREWISGLKPAKNVGSNVFKEIEEIINKLENKFSKNASFQNQVFNLRKDLKRKAPRGSEKPKIYSGQISQYVRDPAVVAWVLDLANGICESCNKPAPFSKEDGSKFLEVHHIKHLADGGSDTIKNAVAVCPNCHSELHYGANKIEKKLDIYKFVKRLELE